ncbi:karyopherin beta [Rhizophlyctis rosea]|nr:karyopherin beta [Rhizophlyctis rosea]
MSIQELLANTLAPDDQIRQDAENKLLQYSNENFGAYIAMLAQELAQEQTPVHIRQSAGLVLKNSLQGKSAQAQNELSMRWQHVDPGTRNQIKNLVLSTLASPNSAAANTAGQVITAIAEIDLPTQQWPDLITTLLQNVTGPASADVNLKRATLQTFGYICEAIDADVLATQANEILTAVAQGARKEELNEDVRHAALKALSNSLRFIHDNFDREGERNYIMQIVCEATQASPRLQVAAFECLVQIMELYYDKMAFYMEKALYRLTLDGMKHENQDVALQAIEFWSTVCEEEMQYLADDEEARAQGIPNPESLNQNFVKKAVEELVNVLWWLMTKKEDDDDEDEWNVSMSAATCLSLVAGAAEEAIVRPLVPHIERHITSEDWRYREAAVMAFGSIMSGPDPQILVPLVQSALPTLISMMRDSNNHVKDTTAWTLGRIIEHQSSAIQPDHLNSLVGSLLQGLEDDFRVASNCAWCIINLSENSFADMSSGFSIVPYFDMLVGGLMKASERNIREPNFRTATYEALSSLMVHAPKECLGTVASVIDMLLQRLEHSIVTQGQLANASVDDKRAHAENQSDLTSTLTACVRTVGGEIRPYADRIMQTNLMVLTNAPKGTTVSEDVYLGIGALTNAVEADFWKYMEALKPFLLSALANFEEYQVCGVAVGLVGDLTRALNEQIAPYCQEIMTVLMTNLQATEINRDLKPTILATFGDVALAIGDKFEPFLYSVMEVLNAASALCTTEKLDLDDYDETEFIAHLRDAVVEAYVGIIQGLKTAEKTTALTPYIDTIFHFADIIANDPHQINRESTKKSLLGLIGDLAEGLPPGPQSRVYFTRDWIQPLIQHVKKLPDGRDVAKWSREMIKRHVEAGPAH